MDILKIEGETHQFGEPRNWSEQTDGVPCGTLSVRAETGAGGLGVLTSKWKPSAADLEILNNGGSIYLGIYSNSHPVVHMYVGDGQPLPTDQSKVVN